VRYRGHLSFGVLAFLVGIPLIAVSVLAIAIAFYEGRKAYWDSEVRKMCEKDGGMVILERVPISEAEAKTLPRGDGRLGVAVKELAAPSAPVYAESKKVILRDSDPTVSRTEYVVIRRSDRKVVARWVYYARGGGDFPTYAHPSSFGCPDLRQITSDQAQLFVLEEGSR